MWTRLLKNNLIYAVGSIANSAGLFLLIPFLVNTLSPAEFGAWSIYEIIVLLLVILITAGMDIGLMRHYWFMNDEEERRRLGGTVLMAVTIWGLFLFILFCLGYQLISNSPLFNQFHVEEFSSTSLLLVYQIGFFEALFTIFLAIFRIREQAVLFVLLSISKMLLFIGGGIAGEKLTGNINGVLAGRLLAAIIGCIAAGFFIYKYVRLNFVTSHLRRILRYGLPLIPASIASYILISSDRYILNATKTLTIVATYTFAYKIASALDIMINRPFATDWAARRFRIATEANPQSKYTDIFLIYLFVSSLAALGLIAISPMLYKLIAPPIYLSGIKVLPILIFAIQIYGLSYPLNIGLVIKDKTSIMGVIGVVSAVFCIAIELWLIPRYGMVGAAWSTLLSYILWTGGITICSLKIYPLSYNIKKILGIAVVTFLGYLGIIYISQSIDVRFGSFSSGLLGVLWLFVIYGISAFILLRNLLVKGLAK